jgi:glycosyltransferase involved in cell wall biosynthesis
MSSINKKQTIAIIGTNGLPGRYGGWDQLLNHLTNNLRDKFSFIVYTSSYNAVPGLKTFNDAELKIIPLKANGIQSIPYDIVSMLHAVYKKYDVLVIMGVSGCIFLPFIKLFSKKIILNIDGAEWKRGKWNAFAKWFLKLSEKFGVKYADIVISDNKIIQNYVKDFYGVDSELIAYGGNNVKFIPLSAETQKRYSLQQGAYAFKVCRIEPENNLDLILEAFSKVTMPLVIVGNWNNSQYGIDLRHKYASFAHLKLLDPIYEQEKIDELRGNCGIYIHGHSVGGTNPSLVEAMSLRLCCFVYDVSYNYETTEGAALYFHTEEDLLKLINLYLDAKIDTDLYKNKLYEIATKRYTWDHIIQQYSLLFEP